MTPRDRKPRDDATPSPDQENPRLLFSPEAAALDPRTLHPDNPAPIVLSPEETRHAVRVLRLRPGDPARLFDGAGRFYEGQLGPNPHAADKRANAQTTILVHAAAPDPAEPPTPLTLLAAAIKTPAADLLVRQAVEIGVARIWFFNARRSVVAPARGARAQRQSARWQRVVIAASKQCGRARLMEVETLPTLEKALQRLEPEARRFACREDLASAGAPPLDALTSGQPICAALGPEGGLARDEIETLDRAGFTPLVLGPRILRAETAALAAATILLRATGSLG